MFDGLKNKLAWAVAGALGFVGSLAFIWRSIDNWIEKKKIRDELEDEIEKSNKTAQNFANTPVTPSDAAKRLRERAKGKD